MAWLLLNRKLVAMIALALALIILTVRVMAWREQAHQNAVDWGLVNGRLNDEYKIHTLGMDLEYGLNTYRQTVEKIEVPHESDSPRFTAQRVQRIQARIAAGEASRK